MSVEIRDCFGFAFLCSVIGPETSCRFLNQSDSEQKPLTTSSHSFPHNRVPQETLADHHPNKNASSSYVVITRVVSTIVPNDTVILNLLCFRRRSLSRWSSLKSWFQIFPVAFAARIWTEGFTKTSFNEVISVPTLGEEFPPFCTFSRGPLGPNCDGRRRGIGTETAQEENG